MELFSSSIVATDLRRFIRATEAIHGVKEHTFVYPQETPVAALALLVQHWPFWQCCSSVQLAFRIGLSHILLGLVIFVMLVNTKL